MTTENVILLLAEESHPRRGNFWRLVAQGSAEDIEIEKPWYTPERGYPRTIVLDTSNV